MNRHASRGNNIRVQAIIDEREERKRQHTRGPLAYFVGNANGRGLIRIEAALDSPDAGEHVASMPRGPKSEANAAEMVRRWDCHPELVAALQRMVADLREIENTGLCRRMRIQQIADIDSILKRAKATTP